MEKLKNNRILTVWEKVVYEQKQLHHTFLFHRRNKFVYMFNTRLLSKVFTDHNIPLVFIF